MPAASDTADLAPQSAPPQDRPAKPTPARIAEILAIVSVLAAYGRHLADTLERRAVARGFATIAQYFGTVAVGTILAHLQRGLMRAIALERKLLRRAARGCDLRILAPRAASQRTPPAKDPPQTGQDAASGPSVPLTPEATAITPAALRAAKARVARRIAAMQPLTLDNLPCMEAIEAEVRRSPVGRTIAAICRDLGISPSLCHGMFWNRLFDAIRCYRGSLCSLVLEVKRREQRFANEEWNHPGLELPEPTRNGIRGVLGFFIGEPDVELLGIATSATTQAVMAAPCAGVAAAATGPP